MAEKPPQRPGQVFGRRVREERDRQQLSLRELADRVVKLGGVLDRSTLAKIERGETRGNLDTLFVLAYALGLAPIHLMVPRDNESPIEVVSRHRISAKTARAWIRGQAMLPESDVVAYLAAMSDDELEAIALKGDSSLASALARQLISPTARKEARDRLREAVEDTLADRAIERRTRQRRQGKEEDNG